MYNPYTAYPVTGTWNDHASYSEGGTDYPLPYGTALYAPASGTFVNNGWVGSAGRRGTLNLDTPIRRVTAASTVRMYGGYVEHPCDMVAIVFQHAKGYLSSGHYFQGDLLGFSGASANGLDYGGDVHLHTHGLCVHGERVDWLKFQGSAVAALDQVSVTEEEIRMAFDGIEIVKFSDTGLSLYVVAQDGRMAKIEDPDVAQQLSAIKSGTFSGKYSRAQFTETRTFLKNLFGIPL